MNTNVDAQSGVEAAPEVAQADNTVAEAVVEALTEVVAEAELEITEADRETAELVGKLAICLLENDNFIDRISERVVAKIAEKFKKQQAAAMAHQQQQQAQQTLPFSSIYDFHVVLEQSGHDEEVRLVTKEGFMESDEPSLLEVYAKEVTGEVELVAMGLDPQILAAIRDALREVNPVPGANYYGFAEVKQSVRDADEANRLAAEQQAAAGGVDAAQVSEDEHGVIGTEILVGDQSENTDPTLDAPADEVVADEAPVAETAAEPVH